MDTSTSRVNDRKWLYHITPGTLNGFQPQFSCSVVSDSLQPHGVQHTRPPCPSSPPRVYSNSCPLSWWCHPTISSSFVPFSSHLQSFPASGSFPMSRLFTSDDQNTGASASALVLPMNIQGWFPLRVTGLITDLIFSLLQHHSSKASILWQSALFKVQLSQPFMTQWETIALTLQTFVSRVVCFSTHCLGLS